MPRGDLGFQGPPLVLFMSLDSPVSLLFPCFRCFDLDRTCAACGVNAMSQAAFGFRSRRLNISTDRQCGLEKPGSLMVLNLSPIPAVLSTPAARRLCPILRLTHLQPLLTTFRSLASGCYYRTYGQTQDVTHELLLLAQSVFGCWWITVRVESEASVSAKRAHAEPLCRSSTCCSTERMDSPQANTTRPTRRAQSPVLGQVELELLGRLCLWAWLWTRPDRACPCSVSSAGPPFSKRTWTGYCLCIAKSAKIPKAIRDGEYVHIFTTDARA